MGISKHRLGAAVLLCSACAREPLPDTCPMVEEGALVVTEIRGAQAGADTRGQWIELYNVSQGEIVLGGLEVWSTELDGSGAISILVRDDALVVGPGEYVVLGGAEPDDLPEHMDYGYALDLTSDLDDAAILEVRSCGAVIDTVIYRDLPDEGTLALDGTKTPTAEGNDEETCWCVDAEPAPDDVPMTEFGIPGTPGEENRACL